MGDLEMRNYVLVVDRSGSMGDSVNRTSTASKWEAVHEYVTAFVRECAKLDPDGIDFYLFNNKYVRFENVTTDVVNDIFQKNAPMGGTDFVPVLTEVFKRHFAGDMPTTVLVITDGEPSDGVAGQKAIGKLLVETANKLEADAELAVSFIQIGQDLNATTFLKKLDDDLTGAGAKFDIVDTKTCDDLESTSIQDVLLAAIKD
jgi:hypothetical protein